jgi:hypothetical protein
MAIWCILGPLGNVMAIWYTFPRFGILSQEKSGNPGFDTKYAQQNLEAIPKTKTKQSFKFSHTWVATLAHKKQWMTTKSRGELLPLFGAEHTHVQRVDGIRVARWFVFKPKIQIWVNFGRSCNGRCWYILWTLGPFYCLLLYFLDTWYM